MNMPDPANQADHDAIETAAVEWLCEREGGFSSERARAFAAWRDADVRHASAVERVERTFGLLAEMPAVRAPLEARFGATSSAGASLARRERRAPRWALGLGAAAALVLGATVLWRSGSLPPDGIQTFATQTAGPRRVALPDGSIVNLNTASELRVSFSAETRAVTLGAGEAHFEVAHDASRPFVVTAGGVAVRAVGTAFNVRLGAEAVDVLVTEGRVALTRPPGPASLPSVAVRPAVSELGAGERASVARDQPASVPRVEKAAPATIRETLAWHSQTRTFSDMPLRDVVAQFNLRNAVQIVLEGSLGDRRIGGSFSFDAVDAFVRLLEQDGDIVATPRGEHEIVLRSTR
jgi:transmembrane sensor